MTNLKHLYVITGVTLIYISIVYGQCPNGFVNHADSCYHFSHDKETWFGALVACEQIFNGRLAEIQDSTENNFLGQKVTSFDIPFWVGGNDLQIEGEWHWQSTNQKMGYMGAWLPHNPSNDDGEENCLELNDLKSHGTRWNDLNCHSTRRYICEKPVQGTGAVIG